MGLMLRENRSRHGCPELMSNSARDLKEPATGALRPKPTLA